MSLFICVLLIFQSVLFTGVVTSPNFPNDYPHNLEESYTIEVEQGQVLLLSFTVFNIDSTNDMTWSALDYHGNDYLEKVTCPSDHLTITDSDGIILMEESCGHILPDRITSRTNKVNLTFHTDDRDVEPSFNSNRYISKRAGWSIIWTALTPGMKALLETSANDCLLKGEFKQKILSVQSLFGTLTKRSLNRQFSLKSPEVGEKSGRRVQN